MRHSSANRRFEVFRGYVLIRIRMKMKLALISSFLTVAHLFPRASPVLVSDGVYTLAAVENGFGDDSRLPTQPSLIASSPIEAKYGEHSAERRFRPQPDGTPGLPQRGPSIGPATFSAAPAPQQAFVLKRRLPHDEAPAVAAPEPVVDWRRLPLASQPPANSVADERTLAALPRRAPRPAKHHRRRVPKHRRGPKHRPHALEHRYVDDGAKGVEYRPLGRPKPVKRSRKAEKKGRIRDHIERENEVYPRSA